MQKTNRIFFIASLTASSFVGASYDESVSGDLSGSLSSPTVISIDLQNIITGTVGNNGNTGATNGSDADYFSFSLSETQTIAAINVISSSGDDVSFIGYTQGLGFSGQTSGDIDGNVFFGAMSGNILPGLSGGPLTGGNYSFWIQETSNLVQSYSIDFVISQVPVPAAAWLFGSGLIALAKFRFLL
ncbi:MAG: VPLPA-CTERM sorting domain-containing protein [Pseudomonadales bacterium]